jgi:hypothetical protein
VSYQVIRQPDDKLAIFSSVTDTLEMWDATPEEVTQHFVDIAVENATRATKRIIEHVTTGDQAKVYHQFAMTWEEALTEDREHDGDAHKQIAATEETPDEAKKD